MKLLTIIDDEVFKDEYINVAKKCSHAADLIWYRIKNKDAAEIYNRAIDLRKSLPCSKLILSARSDIAKAASFDGVHLGADNLPPVIVKQIFPDMIIGYSAHSTDECKKIRTDYITLSPIFDTPKSYKVNPIGLIKAPCDNVFVLGGITLQMKNEFEKLGYTGIAGIRLCLEI